MSPSSLQILFAIPRLQAVHERKWLKLDTVIYIYIYMYIYKGASISCAALCLLTLVKFKSQMTQLPRHELQGSRDFRTFFCSLVHQFNHLWCRPAWKSDGYETRISTGTSTIWSLAGRKRSRKICGSGSGSGGFLKQHQTKMKMTAAMITHLITG